MWTTGALPGGLPGGQAHRSRPPGGITLAAASICAVTLGCSEPLAPGSCGVDPAGWPADGPIPFDGEPTPSELARIDAAEAVRQARAFVVTFASDPPLSRYLEERRGRAIAFERLVPTTVALAHTPYVVDTAGPPLGVQKVAAAYYLVTLGNGCGPVLSVAVSELNDDVRVDERGRIRLPRVSGNDFTIEVVADPSTGFPVTSARATEIVQESGARVSNPPLLVRRVLDYLPNLALWRFEVGSVTVVGEGGTELETEVLYVDARGWLAYAPAEQPSLDTIWYPDPDERRLRSVEVHVRPDRDLYVEPARSLRPR